MSSNHVGGNVQPQLDVEEHIPTAFAKRVGMLAQKTDGSWIAPTVFDLANSDPIAVVVVSGSSGTSTLTGRNPAMLVAPGALSASFSTLYTAVAPTVASLRLYNSGGSTRTVYLSLKNVAGDSDTTLDSTTLSAGASVDYEGLNLSSGNLLRAMQDAGTDVKYYLHGESLT